MILQEIKHLLLVFTQLLPLSGKAACRSFSPDDSLQGVIETGLVVQVVETAPVEQIRIIVRLIGLSYEYKFRIYLLYRGDAPLPEVHGYELHHIAAEAPYSLGRPEQQYVPHLFPGVTVRVIELDGIGPVPVMDMSWIEVALVKAVHLAVISRGHMIGNEVNDGSHSSIACTGHQSFKLLHTVALPGRQIRIDVIPVGNRERRASAALDPRVPCYGMPDYTGIPDIGDVELTDLFENRHRDVLELSGAVLREGATGPVDGMSIAEHPGQHLVYHELAFHDATLRDVPSSESCRNRTPQDWPHTSLLPHNPRDLCNGACT